MADSVSPAPSKKKDLLAVVIVAFIGLMLGFNLFALMDGGSSGSLVGEAAPVFELPVMGEEEAASLENFRGRVVVLDFWATWCPPCREQMPALEAVATDPELRDAVIIFSINTDQESEEREELIRAFLEEQELTLPTLLDNTTVRRLYRVNSIPTLVVIDGAGVVTHISEGLHGESRLRTLIAEAGAGSAPGDGG